MTTPTMMKTGASALSLGGPQAFALVLSGDFDELRALIKEDSGIRLATDNAGASLLHNAAKTGNADVVRVLLEAKAPIDSLTDMGQSPIHWVGSEEVTALLVEAGADIQAKDREGDSPLHNACTMGRAGGVAGLIKAGADVNATNSEGESPLHLVFSEVTDTKVAIDIMTLLIKAGANPEQKNDSERRPIDIIKKQAVLKALLELVPSLKAIVVTGETAIVDMVKGTRFAKYAAMLEGEDIIEVKDLLELDEDGWATLQKKGLTVGAASYFKKEAKKVQE